MPLLALLLLFAQFITTAHAREADEHGDHQHQTSCAICCAIGSVEDSTVPTKTHTPIPSLYSYNGEPLKPSYLSNSVRGSIFPRAPPFLA